MRQIILLFYQLLKTKKKVYSWKMLLNPDPEKNGARGIAL